MCIVEVINLTPLIGVEAAIVRRKVTKDNSTWHQPLPSLWYKSRNTWDNFCFLLGDSLIRPDDQSKGEVAQDKWKENGNDWYLLILILWGKLHVSSARQQTFHVFKHIEGSWNRWGNWPWTVSMQNAWKGFGRGYLALLSPPSNDEF